MKKKISEKLLHLFALLIIALSLLFTLLGVALFVPTFFFKLLSSPVPQIITIGWVLLAASASIWALLTHRQGTLKKSRLIRATILIGLVLSTFTTIFSLTIQPPAKTTNADISKQISFTTYNRLYEVNDLQTPASHIKDQQSDIVSLQEVHSSTYTADFAKLIGLTHFIQAPDNDTGIISRWPIRSSEILQNGSKQVIRAEIDTPHGIVAVYTVHITPPFSMQEYRQGLDELKQLSTWINNDKLPVIVAGDYNTAIYSPEMRSYTHETAQKVKPTTEQALPACSWEGYGKLLCLRIDHVFIPSTASFHGSTISPNLGSDHRAVTVRFSL